MKGFLRKHARSITTLVFNRKLNEQCSKQELRRTLFLKLPYLHRMPRVCEMILN